MATTAEAHLETPVAVVTGDLDVATYERLSDSPVLSWDIETSGLDWRTERIATVQIHDRGHVVLVQHLEDNPQFLKRLLEAPAITKLLHHAMFDLRFMAAGWRAAPTNVRCTKIAAKLLRLPNSDQSLAPLLQQYLGVALDKSEQVSNWEVERLSEAQLHYAARDVCYLEALLGCLRVELERAGKWELAEACFAHLPTRVALELQAYDDVFVY